MLVALLVAGVFTYAAIGGVAAGVAKKVDGGEDSAVWGVLWPIYLLVSAAAFVGSLPIRVGAYFRDATTNILNGGVGQLPPAKVHEEWPFKGLGMGTQVSGPLNGKNFLLTCCDSCGQRLRSVEPGETYTCPCGGASVVSNLKLVD